MMILYEKSRIFGGKFVQIRTLAVMTHENITYITYIVCYYIILRPHETFQFHPVYFTQYIYKCTQCV